MPFIIVLAGEGATGMTAVTNGVTNLLELASTMLNTIVTNPIFATLFAAGFVGIAIGIVRKLKHV